MKETEACGTDFSHVMAHLESGLHAHADRDGLTGVRRAIFIERGGHAPGQVCPTAEPIDPHDYWCQWPDAECVCTIDGEVTR
jgi:hypothetical protein